MKINFTICLIVKNEEKTLPRLFSTLKDFKKNGGEIIILDTGSVDQTVEISQNFGCNVIEVNDKFIIEISEEDAYKINEKFSSESQEGILKIGDKLFNFGAARNEVANYSSTDIVLQLDADDILKKFDFNRICELIYSGINFFEYEYDYCHDQYGNTTVRFNRWHFYNRKMMHWEGNVHEKLVSETKIEKYFLDKSIIDLHHFQNSETPRNYIKALAYSCHKDKTINNIDNFHYFGVELKNKGFYHKAIDILEKSAVESTNTFHKSESYQIIGEIFGKRFGDKEMELAYYQRAVEIDETIREPLYKLCEYYWEKNDYQKVMKYAYKSMKIPLSKMYPNYPNGFSELPMDYINKCKRKIGEKNMKINFSVCVIARNESKNLPRLVKSLSEYLDKGGEIIVLDTGSTDGTPEIARNLGCKVTEVGDKFIMIVDKEQAEKINNEIDEGEEKVIKDGDRIFNFSEARNYCASLASNDIVSMPDADEIFTKLNIEKVVELINQGYDQLEFWFVFSHDRFGNESIKLKQCKMYNRTKMKWNHIVHEVLQGQAKMTFMPEDIFKIEHFQNVETNRSGYIRGLALDVYLNPDNDRNIHYYARELMFNKRPKTAIKFFERHVKMMGWLQERAQSLIHIGECYKQLKNEEKEVESYFKAFTMDSSRREALIRLAEFYFEKRRGPEDLQKVICYATAALEIPFADNFYGNFMGHYRELPHELLYKANGWLCRQEISKYHYDKAISYVPNSPAFLSDRKYYYPDEFEYKETGIDGFMSLGELNWLYKEAKKHKTILEIGSWKGRSTHALLSGCRDGIVVSVDTFKGSEDEKDWTNAIGKKENIRGQFDKNVGEFKNLEVYQMKSEVAASTILKDRKFDMIFIDAQHTYESVKEDIELWKDHATVIICGHDYNPQLWPSVVKAVDEQFKIDGTCESIWHKKIDQKQLIPKKIWSIWLNDNEEIPEKIKKCLESHYIPGYEYKLITLKDAPCNIDYVNEAIMSKKWVKAVDYLRIWYLYNYGGIYLDSDVSIIDNKNFDDLLQYQLFAGREENGFISNAVIGAEKGNKILEKYLLDVPEKWKGDDNFVFEPGMEYFTNIISNSKNCEILSSDYFFPYNHQTGIINVTKNTRAFHHFIKSWTETSPDILPVVSIIIPQLGRKVGLQRCLDSINKSFYPSHLIEIIIVEGDETVPIKVKKGLEKSKGTHIIYLANDTIIDPNAIYRAVKKSENFGLVAFNNVEDVVYPDEGNICAHFLIRKDIIDDIGGEIFFTEFIHLGCDNLLWAKCKKINQAVRCEEAIIRHYHFSNQKAEFDEIYKKVWNPETILHDRTLLAKKLKELEF